MNTDLYKKIEADFYDSLKNHISESSKLRLSVLRLLVSDIKNKNINKGLNSDLTSDEVLSCIKKALKDRQESIIQYKSAGRNDLVENEEKEVSIIREYLPEDLTQEEVDLIVKNVIQERTNKGLVSDSSKFGDVMKDVMLIISKQKKLSDGNIIASTVKRNIG